MGREEKMPLTRHVPAVGCCLCYIFAVSWIAFVFKVPHFEDPYWNGLCAHLESTVVIWLFSVYFSNSSLYDPAWCILPIALQIGWMMTSPIEPSTRALYSFALTCLWYLRYHCWFPWSGWTKVRLKSSIFIS